VHGRALRCSRDHRGFRRRPETAGDKDSSIQRARLGHMCAVSCFRARRPACVFHRSRETYGCRGGTRTSSIAAAKRTVAGVGRVRLPSQPRNVRLPGWDAYVFHRSLRNLRLPGRDAYVFHRSRRNGRFRGRNSYVFHRSRRNGQFARHHRRPLLIMLDFGGDAARHARAG
jgi:hypothetical protein